MQTNPFGTSAPKAPTAAPTAAPTPTVPPTAPTNVPPVVAPTAAPTAPAADGEVVKKPRKPRKQPNRQMTNEERKFVLQSYATMSTNDIAQKLGLTRQQVYRTINESRKILNKRLEALQAMPDTPEKKAQLDKINNLMSSLPNKPFGSGGHRGGNSTESVLDDLLNGLG